MPPPTLFNSILRIISILRRVSIYKSIYFNFKYFEIKTACKLPVFVSRKVKFYTSKGEVILDCKPSPGLIRLGVSDIGIVDWKYERTIWENKGVVIFRGNTSIGAGSKISIDEGGRLEFGNDFTISGRTTINVNNNIKFGDDCMLSWDIMLMDTDYHEITDEKGRTINPSKPIEIGNHVWIGCRSVILKGVKIGNNVIIAANSNLTKSIDGDNCIIGGIGSQAKVIKEKVNWKR